MSYGFKLAMEDYTLYCRTGGRSVRTIEWYRQKLLYFFEFLGARRGVLDMAVVRRPDILSFIDHLQQEVRVDANNPKKPETDRKLSGHTVQGYVRCLRAFFHWLENEELISKNPMKGVRLPKASQDLMPSLSAEDVKRTLSGIETRSALGLRNYAILVVLFDTGIRVSELAGLRLSDVNLQEGFCTVRGKGDKQRLVPLGLTAQRALWRFIRKARPAPSPETRVDYLFLNSRGKQLKPSWVYRIVRGHLKTAGVQVKRYGPHTCRHTFARLYLSNGGDLLTLQRILGHTSLEVVRRYVNLDSRHLVRQQRLHSPVDVTLSANEP